MADNKTAVAIAKHFYSATNRRATKGTMSLTIGQAKHLLDAGFTQEEIQDGIDWYVVHIPRKGFTSLGWLSYDLENALPKIKAQKIKQNMQDTMQAAITEHATDVKHKAKTSNERVKGFDFDIFERG